MSMSCLMVHWLEYLANNKILPDEFDLLELGPQELTTSKKVIQAIAERRLGKLISKNILMSIYDEKMINGRYGDGVSKNFHKYFYSIFGGQSYRSLDLCDPVADYKYDLNYFVPIFRKFDVITNFGTAEHVFEVGKVFKTSHRLLKNNGILLCVLPTFGDIDHGFYNIHPAFYRLMAEQSGYEICDLQYIDDIAWRTASQNLLPNDIFNFSKLPIQFSDTKNSDNLKKIVERNFVDNINKRELDSKVTQNFVPVFDYCFVALKKNPRTSFKRPYQYVEHKMYFFQNILKFFKIASL